MKFTLRILTIIEFERFYKMEPLRLVIIRKTLLHIVQLFTMMNYSFPISIITWSQKYIQMELKKYLLTAP